MSNTTPRTLHLKSLLALEEKRVALQHQIDEILHRISNVQGQIFAHKPTAITQPAGRVARKGRAKRGALKAKIMAALESAGHTGVRVTELASALGTKAANLHAWFHATAKRIPGIIKIAGGHYRLNGHARKTVPAAAKTNARKPGNAKRGGLTDNVMAALNSAGSNGITIKDISAKSGTNYRNVAVWFATTGKKNPKIKKLAPATYKLAA
jgi:hypothetical protein